VSEPVLSVRDLTVTYAGIVHAVRGVSFDVAPGECLALVGESGSGKSSIARAVIGLLPGVASVTGSIRLQGREVVGATAGDLEAWRGVIVGYVWQNPFEATNPLDTIFGHVAEAWRSHGGEVGKESVADRLHHLGIPEPHQRMHRYPHQWSGGMLQRASIAAAYAHHPALIVADEPTSALDADRADATIERLRSQGKAVMLVSHDARLVARHADRVAVCYAGGIVEMAAARDVTTRPRHHYTAGLLRALPSGTSLPQTMPGMPPDPHRLPPGCAFAPRCATATLRCGLERPVLAGGVACFEPLAGEALLDSAQDVARAVPDDAPIVLRAEGLRKLYGNGRLAHTAVERADLTIRRGEIVGISGPSGCGKSTLLRLIAGLECPTAGQLSFGRDRRPGFAMPVFQDATASLDARWPLWRIVSEPATAPHRTRLSRVQRRGLARTLLGDVGLAHVDLEARPSELSGGQCQRVAIARALAADPVLLVADEPTSALDPSVSAVILRLLRGLADRGTAIVIVSHDRAMLVALCDRVLDMRHGELVDDRGRPGPTPTPGGREWRSP
jgi:peptide/nickel transport system ATP-binding protein